MDRARIVPLKKPNQMKSQKVTRSLMMIRAMIIVAAQLRDWATRTMYFFGSRSATTPPHSENATVGTMKDSVTQARSMAEDVRVYTSQPRAMICMFMAKDEPRLPIHSQRKSATSSAL